MAEEKEEVKEADEEQAPKKSKIKLIIIAAVVVLIAAGSFIGYSAYTKRKATAKVEVKKSEEASIICPLQSFVVNLMDSKGVGKRYLKVSIQLEVGKDEDKLLIESHNPQIRDTILLLLSSQTLKEINTMEGKLELKQAILSRMNQILGDGVVHRIYFTEFVVQ